MAHGRYQNWTIARNDDGTTPHSDAELAVMMDIRDELIKLNRLLHCPNFTDIPYRLDQIRRNTAAKLRKKRKKKEQSL
jgi:hypothetical protein